MSPIKGLHHVTISTPDLDRALNFYCGLLGFTEMRRLSWDDAGEDVNRVLGLPASAAETVMLRAGNIVLELFEFRVPTQAIASEPPAHRYGYTHICLDVSDIETVYHRLVAAGIRFHAPPQDFGDIKATYGRDPDGNIFELQELIGDDHPIGLRSAGRLAAPA